MNVLILDDDSFVLSMLQTALVKRGHNVVIYKNPDQCPLYCSLSCPCTLFQNGCPDVILSDVNMPNVNGVKLVEELKRKNCKCTKIGLMSGDWTEADLQKAARWDVVVFFKPFELTPVLLWVSSDIRHVA
jgi:CheY-like chemotaxis protein